MLDPGPSRRAERGALRQSAALGRRRVSRRSGAGAKPGTDADPTRRAERSADAERHARETPPPTHISRRASCGIAADDAAGTTQPAGAICNPAGSTAADPGCCARAGRSRVQRAGERIPQPDLVGVAQAAVRRAGVADAIAMALQRNTQLRSRNRNRRIAELSDHRAKGAYDVNFQLAELSHSVAPSSARSARTVSWPG